jgi:hypothetical protein
MPASTNQLVGKKWKFILPTSLAAVAIVSSALVLHQNNVHAADVGGSRDGIARCARHAGSRQRCGHL